MSDLKCCPFCGNKELTLVPPVGSPESFVFCGCSIMACTKEEAIKNWNTRAPSKDRELLVELSQPDFVFHPQSIPCYIEKIRKSGRLNTYYVNSIEQKELPGIDFNENGCIEVAY